VIAGLLDNRVTNIASKVPWLGMFLFWAIFQEQGRSERAEEN